MSSFKSLLVVAVLVLLVLTTDMSDGRYLPTRSDGTRKEEIRDILQELLDSRMDRSAAMAKRFLARGESSEPEPVSSALYNYESS